jgi:NarL family two-component system sensor histidine kinase YdfH
MFKVVFAPDTDEVKLPKSPIVSIMILVYLSTLFFQAENKLTVNETIGITIIMGGQLLLYLFSDIIFKRKYWLYFLIQGIITFDYSVVTPHGYEVILLGLIPVLIFQCITVYYDAIKVLITSSFFYGIFCVTIIIFDEPKALLKYIPILMVSSIGIRVFSTIVLRQVKLRIQTQKVLKELELAYEKVEELTLSNERQRMARDLHDTLSQGLAGIIMQLEAVAANLNNKNTVRAQEIVQKSMEHARKTLADSRLVIDDLRNQSNLERDFVMLVENEISGFKNVSNISVAANIRIESHISSNKSKHILYILREALNNIAKHSKAKNAYVEMIEVKEELMINITDDGIGFDVKLLDKLLGHYGIMGMNERVRAIQGKIKIKSKRKTGTSLNIVIPMGKGIDEGDE